MSTFTAKAFIEIKNKKQRDFVKEELNKIFIRSIDSKFERSPFFLFANGAYEQNNKYCMFLSSKIDAGFIDCNHYANGDEETAIALFLELAKMREDTNTEETFVRLKEEHMDDIIFTDGFNFDQLWRNMSVEPIFKDLIRNATPLELSEAVQRGEVKLK